MSKIILLVMFLCVIGCVVGAVFWSRHNMFRDVKSRQNCEKVDPENTGCKDCCGVWTARSMCMKGKVVDGNKCESGGYIGPVILLAAGVILLLVTIYYSVKEFSANSGSSTNSGSSAGTDSNMVYSGSEQATSSMTETS